MRRATISSGCSSSATTRAWCGSFNSRCPASSPGIGGGLYAITYEIVTFDALAAPLSANALLMAYIGGSASFGGPILGAVLITLLQSGVSLMSNSWLVYVGVLFISMVIFAPSGIMGLVTAHGPIVRAGQLGRLAVPYLRVLVPGMLMVSALSAWWN